MKKYLVGFMALLLAISFSAFTILNKEKANTTGTYYWYPIENNQVDGPRLNTTKVDKLTAMGNLTNCQDLTSTLCIAGSDDASLGFGDPVPSSQGDNYVNKTN
ncbi:MAG: hypothetical protein HYZ15_01335 [Sphingobacteriales bacterium]|nr:hypothetical protein [Sphingobacteriales bacterium]